jgi:hypothetical protein
VIVQVEAAQVDDRLLGPFLFVVHINLATITKFILPFCSIPPIGASIKAKFAQKKFLKNCLEN